MQTTPTDEMALVLRACLCEMDGAEASFLQKCYLDDPKTTFKAFAAAAGLSPKRFGEIRSQAMAQLQEELAAKNILSVGDFL